MAGRILLAVVVSMLLLPASSASAQSTATVRIHPKAVLVEGGAAALITVTVDCTLGPGDELLEGLVSVSQEQAFGFGSLNPQCDGRAHRITVRVATMGGLFTQGEASVSAFLLFLDPESGTTFTAQDARTVKLRAAS